MVGYDPNQVSLAKFEQFSVGAATSLTSRFFVQPLDVVKIRFQVIRKYLKLNKNQTNSIIIYVSIASTRSNIEKIFDIKISKYDAMCLYNF